MAWGSEKAGDAFLEHDDFVFDPGSSRLFIKELERFINGLVGKAECPVVHGDHPTGFEIEKSLHGIGGAGVDIAKLRRIVGTDGEQGQFGRQTAADFMEAFEIGSVAGVIDGVLAGAQDVSAIAAMRILEDARAPVAGGNVSDFKRSLFVAIPPFKFDNFPEAKIRNQIEDLMRDDQSGCCAGLAPGLAGNDAQRLPVQVIEMSMGDKHDVHRRQVT